MIVCIAEKPSVARDIARILGATAQRDGYMEGNGYQVTWTFGHLCELKEPNDYLVNWRFWTLAALPMIPQRFGIKLIPDRGIEKQFETIAKLYAEADEIINCGDAGQEGELIQRWVMQLAKVKCPVKRLWISSMTDEASKEVFAINQLRNAHQVPSSLSIRGYHICRDKRSCILWKIRTPSSSSIPVITLCRMRIIEGCTGVDPSLNIISKVYIHMRRELFERLLCCQWVSLKRHHTAALTELMISFSIFII